MELFKQLTIMESQRRADEEVGNAINSINDIYKEWKKTQRRKNAVSIVTTSVNKLSNIDPAIVDHMHDAAKLKLATIIMRCMDVPPWMDVDTKRITYRRLFPLINKVQSIIPNTGTNGKLRDIIMTRLSASVCNNSGNDDHKNVLVSYEPSMTKKYLRFIYGDVMPEHVCKMQTLPLPEDFDTLLQTLRINHDKACKKHLGYKNNDR
jgi:hypothetical protein